MCRFIESICCQDGNIPLLDLHQDRVDRTFRSYFAGQKALSLRDMLKDLPGDGKFKCRVSYGAKQGSVEYEPYQTPRIHSLKAITDDQILYNYKFEDRSRLSGLFRQRGGADDILIVRKKLITDSYFANVAFYDGSIWMTPRTPLLQGVRRRHLLENKKITLMDIGLADLKGFREISLINAMNGLGDVVVNALGVR